MNSIAFQLLTLLISAGGTAAPENALLTKLVTEGVKMSDGQIVPLPAPLMAEGLTTEQQAEVLKARRCGATSRDSWPTIPVRQLP